MPALSNVAITDTFDTWRIRTNQIIIKGNDDETITLAAFNKANTFNNVYTTIAGANTAVGTGANAFTSATIAGANTAVGAGANAFATSAAAGANAYMISVQNGSNTAVGTGANAFTSATIAGANTAVGAGANAYAAAIANTIAIAAFNKANNALANSTTTYVGTLTIVGNTTIGVTSSTMNVAGRVSIASANVLSQTLTDAATINWDTSSGQVATVTLTNNRTMAAPTNLRVGTYILHVIQDGTGGRTLTWNSVFKWTAGVAPTLTTAANRRDIFSFICDGTNLYGSFLPDVR